MSAIKEYVAVNREEHTKSLSKREQFKESQHQAQSNKVPLAISFKNFETALKKIKRKVRVPNGDLA